MTFMACGMAFSAQRRAASGSTAGSGSGSQNQTVAARCGTTALLPASSLADFDCLPRLCARIALLGLHAMLHFVIALAVKAQRCVPGCHCRCCEHSCYAHVP